MVFDRRLQAGKKSKNRRRNNNDESVSIGPLLRLKIHRDQRGIAVTSVHLYGFAYAAGAQEIVLVDKIPPNFRRAAVDLVYI